MSQPTACPMGVKAWLLSFFDTNADNRLTFADISVLVALGIFTLKMLGALPMASSDPKLWLTYVGATCGIAGIMKITDIFK